MENAIPSEKLILLVLGILGVMFLITMLSHVDEDKPPENSSNREALSNRKSVLTESTAWEQIRAMDKYREGAYDDSAGGGPYP